MRRIRSKEGCSILIYIRGFSVVYLLEKRKEESPRRKNPQSSKEEGCREESEEGKEKAVRKRIPEEEYLIYIRVSFPPEVRRLLL